MNTALAEVAAYVMDDSLPWDEFESCSKCGDTLEPDDDGLCYPCALAHNVGRRQ